MIRCCDAPRRRLGFPFTLLAVAVCLGAGCQQAASPETATTAAAPKSPISVEVAEVRLQPWPDAVKVQGSLLSDEQAVVGAEVAGRINEVRVDLGTTVHQGDPLVILDTEELQLRVEQAEAQLAQPRAAVGLKPGQSEDTLDRTQAPPVLLEAAVLAEAKANLARGERLLSRQAITNEELGHLQAQVKAAEARYDSALNAVDEKIALIRLRRTDLALAQQTLADAETLAPFDGIIQQRHVAAGEYVNPGQAIVTLVRTNPLRFRSGVPERLAAQIRSRQKVWIQVEGDDTPLTAEVTRISPALDLSSRSLWIEADVPNPDLRLRSGLFAEGEIIVDPQAQTLAVPAEAVTEFAGIERVWLVRDGESVEHPIRTGRRRHNLVEILEGLSAGDTIVANAEDGHAGPVIVRHAASQSGQQAAQIDPSLNAAVPQ